jgi:hypothetical protein
MSFRRMVPYLLLVILVSAAVQLAILYWWDNRERVDVVVVATPTAPIPTIDPNAPAPDPADLNATEPDEEEADAPTGPTVHTVQAGDTLGSISARYDVPLEDIMAANGLTNPNLLSIGQTLTIPIGGLATPTPAPTATPETAVLPTPIPTEAASLQGEAILEISVLNPGTLEEAVQIINVGTRQINLAGWTLRDGSQPVYTFGQVTIFGEGAGILVHSGSGSNGPTDLYLGLPAAIWQPGDSVTLNDADGAAQATYLVP